MRLCLLYPPRSGGRGTNLVPPVGLLYLAAVLERAGHAVVLIDATQRNLAGEPLAEAIAEARPDVVGVTAFTSDMPALSRELPRIRSLLPDSPIWVGGPHPSSVGSRIFDELPEIDAAFIGEAEDSVLEMIDFERSPGGQAPDGVLAREQRSRETHARHVSDLGSLPVPAWHHAPPESYRGLPNGVVLKRTPYAPVLTTRGCPYSCTFCAGHRVTGKRLRHRPMDQVWEEIELLVGRYGVREIHIEDDNFTLDHGYAMEFCSRAVESALPVLYSTPNGVRLDSLDGELLDSMKRAGWYIVHCGIESGSDRVLDLIMKQTDTGAVSRAVDLIRSHGLQVAGYFILGLPCETEADMLETIAFARRSRMEWAHFACFLPLPGSRDGEEYFSRHPEARGDWDRFHNTACPAPPEGISPRRMKQIQKKAFLSFYLRPAHFLRVLSLMFHRGTARRLLSRFAAYLLGERSIKASGPCPGPMEDDG
ncbi:B12-binding domain-containing radical SAM protein [Candidatus Fermentibacterales bacterium]|nr:B12-binding domain-containing radical SAM protein [Candidatus Fermentibacterales bacterium]